MVDTQPVSPHPLVDRDGAALGALDMREWRDTIAAVDRLTDRTIDEGLFAIEHEHRFPVIDVFDSGPALVERVKDWKGTRIPAELRRRTAAVHGPVTVTQEIRLRLLRALGAS